MRIINRVLLKNLRHNSTGLLAVLLLMLLIVGFEAIGPWPLEALIDHVLAPNPIDTSTFIGALLSRFNSREILAFFIIFLYFANTFALAIANYMSAVVTNRVIKTITSQFSKSAFKSLQTMAIGFFKKQQIGDYIYRLSYDVYALGELFEEGLLPLLTSTLLMIVTTTIMFLINVKLTLLSLVALPFLTLGLYSFNTFITHATSRSENYNSAAFAFIEEALSHLKIIQAFSQEHRESRSFEEKIDTSLKADFVTYRLDFLLTLVVGIIIAISYSTILLYGVRAVFANTLTTGFLIVFIFYLDNLTKPILNMIYSVATIKQTYTKIIRMEDFFSPKTHLISEGHVRDMSGASIKFDHVTLKSPEGKKILNDVNFEIQPGKRTLIFGTSGSGKTSVINLILRFVEAPTSGNIYIGGVNVKEYQLTSLRNNIAYVPQEVTLFDDSIRENIAFGNTQSSMKDIREAARLAVADGFIKRLPGGYNFKVGEGGGFLSGGQRQRLMLARAFMKRGAKILLFDETLSELDVKTRQEVINNIFQFSRHKTTIIVSNVFALISSSDNIIVLHKGRAIYSGPSAHLPKETALYRMLTEGK